MWRTGGALLSAALLLAGCGKEPGSTSLTKGTLVIECDESVYPAIRAEADEFVKQYPEAKITLKCVEAREATADFVNDSVQLIVTARPLNDEEVTALKGSKVQYEEYRVAMSAIAVITNKDNPVPRLRMSQLDSIFSGITTHWTVRGKSTVIDAVVGGLNSSTNEVFRHTALQGRGYDRAVVVRDSSSSVVDYVRRKQNAVGIVSVAWLRDATDDVHIVEIGAPDWRPDTTAAPGQYYTPAQAFVFLGYYPVSTPIMMYTRARDRDVNLGFISFVSSVAGQKIIQKSGLVPVTMPVRLVQLSSDQVPQR